MRAALQQSLQGRTRGVFPDIFMIVGIGWRFARPLSVGAFGSGRGGRVSIIPGTRRAKR